MSKLWAIVQGHLDQYGVREAALARRMGTSPQTLNSWKRRGLTKLPDAGLLLALAEETGTPYGEVLEAVLHDIEYLPAESVRRRRAEERDGDGNAAPTNNVSNLPARRPGGKPRPVPPATGTPIYDPTKIKPSASAEALDPSVPDDVAAYTPGGKPLGEQVDEQLQHAGEHDQSTDTP